jgi:hypothetical protein
MQTPTTTTRENSFARDDVFDHARHSDAFEDDRMLGRGRADRLGGAPDVPPGQPKLVQPFDGADGETQSVRRGFEVSVARGRRVGRVLCGSTTASAPHSVASARQPAEKSLAITVRTPCALSMQITARPIGPQPMTIATSPLPTSERQTACQPTAIGSVSAAASAERPLGTGNASECSTTSCSA